MNIDHLFGDEVDGALSFTPEAVTALVIKDIEIAIERMNRHIVEAQDRILALKNDKAAYEKKRDSLAAFVASGVGGGVLS